MDGNTAASEYSACLPECNTKAVFLPRNEKKEWRLRDLHPKPQETLRRDCTSVLPVPIATDCYCYLWIQESTGIDGRWPHARNVAVNGQEKIRKDDRSI